MKFVHLSDLHLGKRINEFPMQEDQAYILTRIVNIIDQEAPDGIIIAGDVYDKSVPSAEAVQMFDDFLCRLASRGLEVFVISGNHDSPERIAFGGRLMNQSGVHMSPVYNGNVESVVMEDQWGKVNVYMLPFVKPAHVRCRFPEETINSYTDAIAVAVAHMQVDTSERNLIVTHQFVTGALRSESEEISVGGSDNVDAAVFDCFDYVALGHIHGPQHVGRETVRYCGTPLKYSFSEAGHKKSVTIVEMEEKGTVRLRTVPLVPMRDLREIRGTYMDLTAKSYYEHTNTEDYLHIILTDEEDIPNAVGKLRAIYPKIMKLSYDNRRTRSGALVPVAEQVEQKTPLTLFGELYEIQNGCPMSEEQTAFMTELIEELMEGEV